ncbi:MAG: type II secretion system F family protein [Candidatus Hydrogenedentes bacterium]|nr:type II secretion system F family protein [Candidatus Hydrogenedentota bacterium]
MVETNLDTALVWVTGASAFVLVASLWFGGLLLVRLRRQRAAEKIETRLQVDARGRRETPWALELWRDGQMVPAISPGQPLRERWEAYFEILRNAMGWGMSTWGIVLTYAGVILLALVVALMITGNLVFGLMAAGAAAVVPYVYVQRQIDRQNVLFERQFSEALGLATRSLRAGQPLMGAFHLIVEEMDPPVSRVFEEICQEQALGMSLDGAVRRAARKTMSPDMKLFAASMGIQLRSGGNVSEMMERLADVIRDRIRLHRRARVLTAQTQLSKRVLIGMPFVIFMVLYLLNRNYLSPLYETSVGRGLLLTACILLVIGTWIMNRIAVLHY